MDRDLDRQRQRRRAGQPARPGIRHDVGPVREFVEKEVLPLVEKNAT
jgi:hypothetical protein